MLEVYGDAWELAKDFNAICVTTNGVIKNDGSLVMGRGIADQCAKRYPNIPKVAGDFVSKYGNRLFNLGISPVGYRILSFPTKHNWQQPSDLNLIEKSARELVELTNKTGWSKILLPRPGVGLGGLDWNSQVKPMLERILDNRFYIVTYKKDTSNVIEELVNRQNSYSNNIRPAHEELRSMLDEDEEDNTLRFNSICVTGHRPKSLWGYKSSAKYQQLQQKIYDCVDQFYNQFGTRRCISGGAQGGDQLFFWVINYMRQHVHKDMLNELHIPFNGQDVPWLENGNFSREEYRNMLNCATSMKVVNKQVTNNSPKYEIVKAMHARNISMLNVSDCVLGIYHGKIEDIKDSLSNKDGGTVHCLKNAYAMGKPIVIINPLNLTTTRLNF